MRVNIRKALAAWLLFAAGAAPAQPCYETSIMTPSPFMGNHGEIFKTADGALWEVQFEYLYLYEYLPTVIICPGRGKLSIKGKTLNIAHVGGSYGSGTRPRTPAPAGSDVIETRIDGEFNGWDGETIFKLQNGQIWQQASYAYTYTYKYSPRVTIFRIGGGYEMQVEDMDRRIGVRRLR
jgi:hypothetical protein